MQVYMASMFENQYKLLARSENKVQEVSCGNHSSFAFKASVTIFLFYSLKKKRKKQCLSQSNYLAFKALEVLIKKQAF